MKSLFIMASIFLYFAPGVSVSAQCLHYLGDPVTLTGKLTTRTFYGPPSYGENPDTDARETQLILILTKPICVNANEKDNDLVEQNQGEVTLVALHGEDLRALVGKRIDVTGTLFHANTDHHHTPVVIEIFSVRRHGE